MILALPNLTLSEIRGSSRLMHLPSAECMWVVLMFLLHCLFYNPTLLLRASAA